IFLPLFDFIEEEFYGRKRFSEDISPLLRIFSRHLRRVKIVRQIRHFYFKAQGNPERTRFFRCFLPGQIAVESDDDPRRKALETLKVCAGKGGTRGSYGVSDPGLMREHQIYLSLYENGVIFFAYLVFGLIQTVENFTFGEKDGVGTIKVFGSACLRRQSPTRESNNRTI